jgi:serine/threonine protein kinase
MAKRIEHSCRCGHSLSGVMIWRPNVPFRKPFRGLFASTPVYFLDVRSYHTVFNLHLLRHSYTSLFGDENGKCLSQFPAHTYNSFGSSEFSCMQVLTHTSQCLRGLHKAGLVHRHIKPCNIMWLPRRKRWTVGDFAHAVRAGTDVPLAFTTAYAPPEVAKVRFKLLMLACFALTCACRDSLTTIHFSLKT